MADDKFVSPCPPPTGFAREITEIIAEEAAEVIQRATKLLRFGVEEVQPGQPHTNAYRLGMEVGDLIETVERAVGAGLIPSAAIMAGRGSKRRQLDKYLQSEHPHGGTTDGQPCAHDWETVNPGVINSQRCMRCGAWK